MLRPPSGPNSLSAAPTSPSFARFDRDGDKKLNAAERKAALNALGGGGGGFYRSGFSGGRPGPALSPSGVRNVPASVPFYDLGTLRTLFFQFEDDKLGEGIDGVQGNRYRGSGDSYHGRKIYKEVGVKFRGSSSFAMVPEGMKHSLNVSVDAFTKDQTILGFESLNLLSSHADPTFLRGVLYLQAARDFLPSRARKLCPRCHQWRKLGHLSKCRASQQDLPEGVVQDDAGTRWKAPGDRTAERASSIGETVRRPIQSTYEIKGKDDPKAWAALIHLRRF